MPRYWVIAPVGSKNPEIFDKVWQASVADNSISIGWSDLGDISKLTKENLFNAVSTVFPRKPPGTVGLITNMLWAFYHEIKLGDIIIARRGLRTLAAIGKVTHEGVYFPGKNPLLTPSVCTHPHFLKVQWQQQPRDIVFPNLVFPQYTLAEISETRYNNILGGKIDSPEITTTKSEIFEGVEAQNEFVLEKYLEEFIVDNFETIFKETLVIYKDDAGKEGRQYQTPIGRIDILALEAKSDSFIVIELKKCQTSDQVVGQILRYMGWVKKNRCKDKQTVKGLIICRDADDQLSYALSMTNNIDVRYYKVSFDLREKL